MKFLKRKQIDKIFNIDKKTGFSRWVSRDELKGTALELSNNGNCRYNIFFNDNRYIWENQKLKNKVIRIRTRGYNPISFEYKKRPIRMDIRREILKNGCCCVVCGSKTNLVVDHKNDLYNDPRVLNIKTQVIDDFQCLCNHCNLQKRQVCKWTRKTGKRYSATRIPLLEPFGIDFIKGTEEFDPKDPQAMVGTFWYDPVEFMRHIIEIEKKP